MACTNRFWQAMQENSCSTELQTWRLQQFNGTHTWRAATKRIMSSILHAMPKKYYLYNVSFCDCLEHDQSEAHVKSVLKSGISNFYLGSSIYTWVSSVGRSRRPWTSHFTSGASVLSCANGRKKKRERIKISNTYIAVTIFQALCWAIPCIAH